MPFLSVIVPFFGDIDQAEACLVSIQASHYRDCEVIIADDGAADALAVPEIASRHGARFVRLDSNSGPAAARNAAGWETCLDRLVGLHPSPDAWRGHFEAYSTAFEPTLGPQEGPPAGYKGS